MSKTYEDLIRRLRECTPKQNGEKSLWHEAADAIEELMRRCEQFQYMPLPAWIPVTERLPDNIDEEVLVCTEDYGKNYLGFVTVAIYDGSNWLECWERKTYLTAVTHWMPLPEPPKGERA